MDAARSGRRCSACSHPRGRELDRDIVRGTSLNAVARNYGLSQSAVHRHAKNHLPEELRKELLIEFRRERAAALDAEINQERVDISSGLQSIIREIEGILNRSKAAGDDQLALTALRDMRGTLLDLARLHGQLQNVTTLQVNIAELPQWAQLRSVLVEVFNEVPAARDVFIRKTRHLKLIEAQ
jgi:AcrR family transcriptional regulator